ncbi:hypothetical protein QFC21_000964 [Naganishia friedmannii]|uniref:Uncharacterized protein n=1 Tax=Naganishia friedmannii TaxID=89922 RepID=A0ACC2W7W9_9TREE|nr:hypothetical protein QFC21_000964 [Naganishia friedmannii]
MPSPTSHLSQPIYFLPGPPYPPSMRHTPYGESAELPISAYTTYIQPGPVFQTAYDDMGYSHMPVRAMRPASTSSSDSPDEILMTPFMVQGNQGLDPTQYVSYIQSQPAFAPSVTPMPIGLQLNGISGMYGPSTARTSSASIQTVNNPEATEHQGPTVEQPVQPPLCRRHTDSLPFSHSPLKRTIMGSSKPYDSSPSERLRRPLSAIDTPINSRGMGFLAIDNAYVAKQRIACQGCREKKLKCTGASPVCYNCSKKGRTQCKYVSTVRRRGPGKKRLDAEARAVDEGYSADSAPGIPAQYAFWAGGDGQS